MAVWAVSTGTLPMPYISGAGASFLAVGDLQDVYADSRSESSLGFLVLTGYALRPGHKERQ